jgi:hypothetical protein
MLANLIGVMIVFALGALKTYKKLLRIREKLDFSIEYHNKFIEFSNLFVKSYDKWNRSGDLDEELYVWLTKNVNKIHNYLGRFGLISYKPAFQNDHIRDYPIIINTIPKFREGEIQGLEVGIVSDCLIRYIGYLENCNDGNLKNLKNPIIWFREGFKYVLSFPIFILSWFDMISNRTVTNIMNNLIYRFFSGLVALIALISSIVTLILGYEQTIKFFKVIIAKY